MDREETVVPPSKCKTLCALDFGMVADWDGQTGTNNYAVLAQAIAAAITQKRPLFRSRRVPCRPTTPISTS